MTVIFFKKIKKIILAREFVEKMVIINIGLWINRSRSVSDGKMRYDVRHFVFYHVLNK